MSLEQVPEKRSSGTGFEVDQKMDSSNASGSHVETAGGTTITRKQILRKIDTYLLPLVSPHYNYLLPLRNFNSL
jgi:hypothetical protein